MSLHALLLALTCVAAADMERIRVGAGGRGFSLDPSGKPFTPWGLNYGNDGLIEDSWGDDWPKLVGHFEEMKARNANVARVHLQFGKFMDGPDRPIAKALDRLGKLLELAEEKGLYLDLTGLGCYRKADVPVWYDGLSEEDRWSAQARFWGAVAERCTKSPAVFCYDLMNEPFVPGEKRKPGEWYSGKPIGEYDFVQFITLDRGDRPREEVARRWVKRLARSVREHDPGHLITVGLLPWTFARGHLSGFVPEATAPELDFVSVHIYPGKGKVDEALKVLEHFAVSKPVAIEETFPLAVRRRIWRTSSNGRGGLPAAGWGITTGQRPSRSWMPCGSRRPSPSARRYLSDGRSYSGGSSPRWFRSRPSPSHPL